MYAVSSVVGWRRIGVLARVPVRHDQPGAGLHAFEDLILRLQRQCVQREVGQDVDVVVASELLTQFLGLLVRRRALDPSRVGVGAGEYVLVVSGDDLHVQLQALGQFDRFTRGLAVWDDHQRFDGAHGVGLGPRRVWGDVVHRDFIQEVAPFAVAGGVRPRPGGRQQQDGQGGYAALA